MKTKKQLLSILLSLVLVLGLMPGMTLTAYAADDSPYGLYVGGQPVKNDNLSGTGWEFSAGTNTLTLSRASIDAGYERSGRSAGIYYYNEIPDKPLNIILNGTNTISGNNLTDGIYGADCGSFIFSGDGTLNTTGTSSGISTYYGSVKIDSGAINASGNELSGIYVGSGSITINDGNVEATGPRYGIAAKGVSMTGGTVTAKATNSTSDTCYAIYDGLSGISITGGTVTAIGTSSSGEAYGLYKGSSGNIKIGAGITSLTVTGTTSASHGTVENSVAGMGWNTVDGTGDGTEIAVNTSGASLDTYKKLVFPYTKPAAIVTTVPTAKNLPHTGAAQELVTAGEASGGTMQYALGNDATTAPTEGWSTSIPAGTNAGTYYVWYKAVGTDGYTDSKEECIPVTITEGDAASDEAGKDASAAENKYEENITDAPVSEAKVDGLDALAKEGAQTGATYHMEIKEASSGSEISTIDTYADRMYEKANGNFTKKFLDFSIIKTEVNGDRKNIHETGKAMKVTFTITGDSNICSPIIWRYHGGDATAFSKVDEASASGEDCTFSVEGEGSNTATFHVYTSEFSTYAVTYAPTPVTLNNNYRPTAPAGGGGGSSSGGTDGVIRVDGIVSGGTTASQAAGSNPAGTAANGLQTDGTGLQAGATVNGGAVNDAAGVAAANGKANPKSNGKTNPAAGASEETAPKMGDPADELPYVIFLSLLAAMLFAAFKEGRQEIKTCRDAKDTRRTVRFGRSFFADTKECKIFLS